MKKVLLCSIAGCLVLMSGCAPAPLTKADVDGKVVCNADQMDRIERAARRENKEIHWVHCPLATLRVVS